MPQGGFATLKYWQLVPPHELPVPETERHPGSQAAVARLEFCMMIPGTQSCSPVPSHALSAVEKPAPGCTLASMSQQSVLSATYPMGCVHAATEVFGSP